MTFPRISFGIIVLNGEPFTRYCLRTLYPFAYEIIVVEGAAPGSAEIATQDGHSTDGTLEILRQFKAEEDPENKLQIVVRDGFWSEKDEMSQAYAARATGDYLWQVDVDEFYKAGDMTTILTMLRDDPSITAMSFKMMTFWGGFDYICDGWYLKSGAEIYHRLFKWGTNYTYLTHRPPTVLDDQGRDLRSLHWIDGYTLAQKHNILMYHYSLVFPKQVLNKSSYYRLASWSQRDENDAWAQDTFLNLKHPFQVHNVYNYPSWLEHFTGTHPAEIEYLRDALQAGKISTEQRPNDDIEHLLSSKAYQLGRALLKRSAKSHFIRAYEFINRILSRINRQRR